MLRMLPFPTLTIFVGFVNKEGSTAMLLRAKQQQRRMGLCEDILAF
jgi:hypothetical protein